MLAQSTEICIGTNVGYKSVYFFVVAALFTDKPQYKA